MTINKFKLKAITFSQRAQLQDLLEQEVPKTHIANEVGISVSSVRREIKRCSDRYNAEEAQLNFDEKRKIRNEKISLEKSQIMTLIDNLAHRIYVLETFIEKNIPKINN